MSKYFRDRVQSAESRPDLVTGKFSLSAAAAVSSTDMLKVASVVKTGTGTYTLTLQDKYASLRSAQISHVGSQVNVQAKVAAHDVSSAKTISIRTETAGAAADVTAACEIHLSLVLRDSSVSK